MIGGEMLMCLGSPFSRPCVRCLADVTSSLFT